MDKSATTNNTKKPTDKDEKSLSGLKRCPRFLLNQCCRALYGRHCPAKENSTIVFLFRPKIKPPVIVAAARETQGWPRRIGENSDYKRLWV